MLIMVKSFLCLCHHHHGHLVRWDNSKNQIWWCGIINDNIKQEVNVISWQHDVNPPPRRLKRRRWKDVSLHTTHETLRIHNGGECILHGIMGCNLFPTMGETKKMVLARSRGWSQMRWINVESTWELKDGGSRTWCTMWRGTFKAKWKDVMTGQAKS